MAVISYIDAVTMAIREEMERDPRVFILGEDVGRKGGVLRQLKDSMKNLVKNG